jgi:hypothetical protein
MVAMATDSGDSRTAALCAACRRREREKSKKPLKNGWGMKNGKKKRFFWRFGWRGGRRLGGWRVWRRGGLSGGCVLVHMDPRALNVHAKSKLARFFFFFFFFGICRRKHAIYIELELNQTTKRKWHHSQRNINLRLHFFREKP